MQNIVSFIGLFCIRDLEFYRSYVSGDIHTGDTYILYVCSGDIHTGDIVCLLDTKPSLCPRRDIFISTNRFVVVPPGGSRFRVYGLGFRV